MHALVAAYLNIVAQSMSIPSLNEHVRSVCAQGCHRHLKVFEFLRNFFKLSESLKFDIAVSISVLILHHCCTNSINRNTVELVTDYNCSILIIFWLICQFYIFV